MARLFISTAFLFQSVSSAVPFNLCNLTWLFSSHIYSLSIQREKAKNVLTPNKDEQNEYMHEKKADFVGPATPLLYGAIDSCERRV